MRTRYSEIEDKYRRVLDERDRLADELDGVRGKEKTSSNRVNELTEKIRMLTI